MAIIIACQQYSAASRIKDLARNTIVVPADQIDSVVAMLADNGANIKRVNAATDPLGYSGVNSSLKCLTDQMKC